MKPVYVIGHKNPDVDSVAAAISYKVYKQSTDKGIYIAAAAGEITHDISFILDTLGFEAPLVLKNVGTTVEDLLEEKDILYVTTDMTLVELGNLVRKHDLKTIPVLDNKHRFLGLITVGDLAMIFMDSLGGGREIDRSPEILRGIFNQKVADIMKTRDLILFEKDESVDEARKHMLASRYRNYPVVDEKNNFLGMISRYNLLQMKRKQVILVDHNEKKQAVDGIEDTEILEIIDHHRVGDLQTISPIYFHNEPVGSTCTLVAEKFMYNRIYITKEIAGLLLSGILSDTMIFKSPTTTGKDVSIAKELETVSGLDPRVWGRTIFEQMNNPDDHTDYELISEDLKEYVSGEEVFAISQIETIDNSKILERRDSLMQVMNEICQKRGYLFLGLMITNVFEEETELLVAGEKSGLVEKAFGTTSEGSVFLKGIMSRKKQVVPALYEVIRKEYMV